MISYNLQYILIIWHRLVFLQRRMHCIRYTKTYIWNTIQYGCAFAFLIQMCIFLYDQAHPTLTETNLEERKLEELDFPVIFKLCFQNSFNLEKIVNAGYSSVSNYFKGKSRFNSSVFGWAGHNSRGILGPGVTGIHQTISYNIIL